MPLPEFVRLLADESGRSVIVGSDLDGQLVTGEFRGMSPEAIVGIVARRLGCSSRVVGRTFFLGAPQPEDRGQLVARVRRLDADAIKQVATIFGGKESGVLVQPDGLVIITDRVEVLEQVAQAFASAEAEESPVWIVQLHLVGWSRRAAHDYGIDVAPAAALAATFAAGSTAKGVDLKADVTASLDAVLRLANDRADVAVVAAPMMTLLDGETAEFIQGDRVPIPRRTTSDQGTVTTNGFEFIQTGTTVKIALRERSPSSAMLSIDVGMSDIRRLVEEAPVTGEERLTTGVVVEAGGVYLVGSLARERHTAETGIGWRTQDAEELECQVIQVWCEAFRVAGPLCRPHAPLEEKPEASVPPGPEATADSSPSPAHVPASSAPETVERVQPDSEWHGGEDRRS